MTDMMLTHPKQGCGKRDPTATFPLIPTLLYYKAERRKLELG